MNLGERIVDGPDQEDTRKDLHNGGHDGCSNPAQ
jgi:hypothetical protein